jgi:glycosyltransferase involved in cell wall biosynthesis
VTTRRLTFLFPHPLLGGGETAMMPVAEGLRETFDLTVAVRTQRQVTLEMTIEGALEERFHEVLYLEDEAALQTALRRTDILLWYGTNTTTPLALESLSREPGGRPAAVRVVHTEKVEEGEAYLRRWRHVVDGVCCVSPRVARRIPGAHFIPNAADPRRLTGAGERFFDDDRPVLGYLGRLYRFKNVPWLVEHLDALGCNLLIQGMDSTDLRRGDLEALAARCGVARRLHFLPPGPTVGTFLRSIDALAVLSQMEGFPMVVVEAGTLGVPVIATPVGALPEIFPEAILYAPFDGSGTEPRLDRVREAVARVTPAHGTALQQRVEAVCALDTVVTRYAELLERALRNHPRGGPPP